MLIKLAIFLTLGVISSYFCALYIFESNQFENYMNYILKDYDNPSAAIVGLVPEFVVFINLIVSLVVHLFAIFLYRLLRNPLIATVIKKIILVICAFAFTVFSTISIIGLKNVYEGYLVPTLIPLVFWVSYGVNLLFVYFKSQMKLIT